MTPEVAKKELTLCVLIWDSSQDALKQKMRDGASSCYHLCVHLKRDIYEEAQTISRRRFKNLATEVSSGTEAGRGERQKINAQSINDGETDFLSL